MNQSEAYYPSFFNQELILDLNLQAFSHYDISGAGWHDDSVPGLVDYITLPDFYYDDVLQNVVDKDGVLVTNASGDPVTVYKTGTFERPDHERNEKVFFIYLAHHYNAETWCGISNYNNTYTIENPNWLNTRFKDWASFYNNGYDFPCYLLTGYNVTGDIARQKQAVYLQTYFKRTEDVYKTENYEVVLDNQSGCLVSSQWDWNTSASQGKWGTSFEAYRFIHPLPSSPVDGDIFDYGESVIDTKNKLRGRGRALSLLFEAENNKDVQLLGWNLLATINGEP